MSCVGLVVDWVYSHTTEAACNFADWLDAAGYSVNIYSVNRKAVAVNSEWDDKVVRHFHRTRNCDTWVWFIPPSIPEIKYLGQDSRCVLVVPTAKIATSMAAAAPFASSVVCLSQEAVSWFKDNLPGLAVIAGFPTPLYKPIKKFGCENIRQQLSRKCRIIVAAPSHTTLANEARTKLLGSRRDVEITLLTRGPKQARKHVKTPHGFYHAHNQDLSEIPELLASHDLLLWQSTHRQDNIGLLSLWLGVPVVTNNIIEGCDPASVLFANDRNLITTTIELIQKCDRLAEMKLHTFTGLEERLETWNRLLKQIF